MTRLLLTAAALVAVALANALLLAAGLPILPVSLASIALGVVICVVS